MLILSKLNIDLILDNSLFKSDSEGTKIELTNFPNSSNNFTKKFDKKSQIFLTKSIKPVNNPLIPFMILSEIPKTAFCVRVIESIIG